jgi:hypothetical protein
MDNNKNSQEDIFKNSKYAKLFVDQDDFSKYSESVNKQPSENNNKYSLIINSNSQIKKDNEEKKLNESFIKLRQNNPQVLADYEAEEHIQQIRDIGEYNRWSLKLVQKWLGGFYTGKAN